MLQWRRIIAVLAVMPLAPAARAQTAPPLPLTVTGSADVVSDYRFRGLTRSDGDVAVQGNATVQILSGFYAGVWASSIHGYVAQGAGAEFDLLAGYRRSFLGTTVDGGVLYYVYPGGTGANYAEPYLSIAHTLGPVSAKIGGNVAWSQRALAVAPGAPDAGGAYGYGEVSAGIPTTPFTLTAHLGHSFVRNAVTFDRTYTDWSLAAAASLHHITASVAYVDADTTAFAYPRLAAHGGDIAGGTVVGSLAFAF